MPTIIHDLEAFVKNVPTSYWYGTDTLSTGNRQATNNLPTSKRQNTNSSFHFQAIVSLAMDSERQFPEYIARKWSVMSSMCITTVSFQIF